MKAAFLVCLALVLVNPAAATEVYRGFTLIDQEVSKLANHDEYVAVMHEQVDIVHSVGLPEDILKFLQSVKLELLPAGAFKSPTPGRYTGRREQSVQMAPTVIPARHKPVLLHELMHAYHDQRIEDGFKNALILEAYKQAGKLSVYAAQSHMMSNAQEYFACTATTYLFGVTAQEPFTREKVREHQPDFHAYLKKLFGPDAGAFVGSLTR